MVKGKGGRWKRGKEEVGDAKPEVDPPIVPGDIFLPDSHKLRFVLDENGIGEESPQKQFQQMNWKARPLVTYGGPRFADGRKSCYLDKKYPVFEVTLVARARGGGETKEVTVRIRKSDVYVGVFKSTEGWYGYSDENMFSFLKSYLRSGYGGVVEFSGISAELLHMAIWTLADFNNSYIQGAQDFMFMFFWWISEAVRFKSIYDQIDRVLGTSWSYSEDLLPEDTSLVNEWQKTSLAMIDAHFHRDSRFEAVEEATGIVTYNDAKEKVAVLKLEEMNRVFKRWPEKYRPENEERPPLLLPKPKIRKKTDQERNAF